MDWLMFYAVMAIAAAAITLMLGAFALLPACGGWQRAMQLDATGRWPLPRLLMAAGAALCMLFGLLLFVPGAVPYWDLSSPGTPWMMGVIFGFSVSICSTTGSPRRCDGAVVPRRGAVSSAPGRRPNPSSAAQEVVRRRLFTFASPPFRAVVIRSGT